jgi:hypothetical protein
VSGGVAGVTLAMTGTTVNVEFAEATELRPPELTLMLLLPAVTRFGEAGTITVKV